MAFQKGHTPWNKGLTGIKTSSKGQKAWNKGKTGLQDYMNTSGLKKGRGWWKGKVGKSAANYKTGRKKNHNGYIVLLEEGTGEYKRFEHRVIMEKHLGRELKKEEVVHHINNIKDDNRIENLMLFENQKKHIKHHASKEDNWGNQTAS